MATLKGIIRDSVSGASVEAKVHVLTSSGRFVHPTGSILKIGPGDPVFLLSRRVYCRRAPRFNRHRG